MFTKEEIENRETREIKIPLPKTLWSMLEGVSQATGRSIGQIIESEIVAWHVTCDQKAKQKKYHLIIGTISIIIILTILLLL